jgi:predicted dehydrogenase
VGCGHWGRYILRDLKSLNCQVTVVAPSPQGRFNAKEFGADHIVDKIDEFGSGLDGFIVATPAVTHAEVVFSLLRFERPIFVEKPLTNSPELARKLVAAAGDRIFVMDKWRYHPGIEALRDIAVSGELGPVESIRMARLGWSISQKDVDLTWTLLPHDLAIVQEIIGYVPDPALAVAEYANSRLTGLVGVLGGSPSVVLAVSERNVETVRSIAVNFRQGAALLEDAYSGCIKVRRVKDGTARKDDPMERRPVSDELPLLREVKAFVYYLQGGPRPRSSAHEATRVIEVIDDLRRRANVQG